MNIQLFHLYPESLPNSDKKNPSNQITSGRVIYYVVGEQAVDERLVLRGTGWREVLYDLPRAQKAFAYSTKNIMAEITKIDIGIIIVDIPVLKISNPIEDRNTVRPIDLPDKGYVQFIEITSSKSYKIHKENI